MEKKGKFEELNWQIAEARHNLNSALEYDKNRRTTSSFSPPSAMIDTSEKTLLILMQKLLEHVSEKEAE